VSLLSAENVQRQDLLAVQPNVGVVLRDYEYTQGLVRYYTLNADFAYHVTASQAMKATFRI